MVKEQPLLVYLMASLMFIHGSIELISVLNTSGYISLPHEINIFAKFISKELPINRVNNISLLGFFAFIRIVGGIGFWQGNKLGIILTFIVAVSVIIQNLSFGNFNWFSMIFGILCLITLAIYTKDLLFD
jgi:hypothetical protein